MALFDSLIAEISSKFGLAAKAGPLITEVIRLIGSEPGGLTGFLNRFRTAGLGNLVSSWLGNRNPEALSPQQVQTGLGGDLIGALASKLGLGSSAITPALGYVIPKLIAMLTPDGTVPAQLPATWQAFAAAAPAAGSSAIPRPPAAADKGGLPKWLLALLALLIVGGLGWWWWSSSTEQKVAATAPTSSVQTTPAVQPKLGVTYHDSGYVTYSGVVKDDASRSSIVDTLKSVFGADSVFGNIAVDPNAAAAPWLGDLKAALEKFKIPGLSAAFEGLSVKIGGLIADIDRDRILDSLKGLFGGSYSLAALTDDANAKAIAALNALKAGYGAADVVPILNLTVVNFASNSAEVPAFNRAVLKQAALVMKQLPAGTVIEISGHTDSSGDAAANQQLSQQRADAVRLVLIEEGVPAEMVIAKGYGSSRPKAGNETAQGRYQNRRIEYAMAP